MTDDLRYLLSFGLRITFDPCDENKAVVVQVCKPRTPEPPFVWSQRFLIGESIDAWVRDVRSEFVRDWL